MKSFCAFLAVAMVPFVSSAQSANTLMASISGVDRMTLVRTSIDIPTWHEKEFWPVYEHYVGEAAAVASQTYRALDDLARTGTGISDEEALDNAHKLLQSRNNEFQLLESYYQRIGKEFNGIIALQFLQSETLLSMMESCRIYDNSPWKRYRFHPTALSPEQFARAKRNTITKALGLSNEEADTFWEIYSRYEEDCNALLGENYDMIASFAGEATDFTPALAKRLGYNFLTVISRELKLKEKYFDEMNSLMGPSLAAQFLAWEDYYSLVSKMHAWADAP